MHAEIRLTKWEQDAINHRLAGCPDAIVDAMMDEEEPKYTVDELWAAINKLQKEADARVLVVDSEVAADVIYDVMDGSTFCACVDDVFEAPQFVGLQRKKMIDLAAKVSKALGRHVRAALR